MKLDFLTIIKVAALIIVLAILWPSRTMFSFRNPSLWKVLLWIKFI